MSWLIGSLRLIIHFAGRMPQVFGGGAGTRTPAQRPARISISPLPPQGESHAQKPRNSAPEFLATLPLVRPLTDSSLSRILMLTDTHINNGPQHSAASLVQLAKMQGVRSVFDRDSCSRRSLRGRKAPCGATTGVAVCVPTAGMRHTARFRKAHISMSLSARHSFVTDTLRQERYLRRACGRSSGRTTPNDDPRQPTRTCAAHVPRRAG